MRFIYNYLFKNAGFVCAMASCLLLVFAFTPYHQSVSRKLTAENLGAYSVTLDINNQQLDSLLQHAQVCIYNSARVHLYNFLSPASSLGYECSPLSAMDNVERISDGLRVKLFATTTYKLKDTEVSNFKAKIILGEVPLAYEIWRRLNRIEVSTHKIFERPKAHSLTSTEIRAVK